ncbi:coiled-coil and C2 domain-containing protein 1B-like [Sinocyclocheilus grahami]|uniref:coiled-coil and C2 domain-containing protein 1B-like n=1 Tax=Sinocyclocheilus grahami TaxID=75366 RepID=UPI0007AD57D7|nr:PREDICTED: coiled-coil and C2 domain-containing protein 1B-like [Sinocyclocheilus grahami]
MILKIFCVHLNKFYLNFYVQAPLPMEDIEKMAEACMKDIDDDEDDSLEDDEDLLAELQEVVDEEETEDSGATTPASPISAETSSAELTAASHKYDILQSCFCKGYIVVSSAPKAHSPAGQPTKDILLERQKEYRMAALKAKQAGDIDQAKMHIKASKGFDAAVEALEKGQPVDMSSIPPPLSQASTVTHPAPQKAITSPSAPADSGSGPAQPQTVLEALEQRMAKYKEAFTQAKASGDERKARMHDRIAKQYQAAIRAHKADRPINFDELPAPPAQQQLEFLEGRKKQYMKAALQAKQKNDLEHAKTLLRAAKSLDPMIEAARSGKTVDVSKVPSPPGDEDKDFILVHHSDVQISEKAEEVYTQLTKLLKEQYEKCVTYSKQFTHMGNVAETTKFENMAEQCKKSLEILKLAQNRGLQPPKHYFEERTYRTVRIFPELSSTDMVVFIVRGMNLPAPSGVATNDLDAYVKFDFPYPSTDQPQKHKTSVIKNTNNPGYNQSFKLNINRNHRGFRRVIQSKGLKLEVLHKGGFLRSDKPIGTALLKLEKLETESEVREIVELMDGRKATGGRLEVRVRLREPLGGQDHQTVTERWLVLEEPQVLL